MLFLLKYGHEGGNENRIVIKKNQHLIDIHSRFKPKKTPKGLQYRCMNSLMAPKDNQNPQNEGQTMQWPKEKGQKEKQRSIKHTHKTKDRGVTRMFKLFLFKYYCTCRLITYFSYLLVWLDYNSLNVLSNPLDK